MKLLQYRIFGYTISYIIEKHGGTLLAIATICICFFFIKPSFSTFKNLIKEFPTLGMCAFGFLLTFLGIIIQGDSETIKWFKSRTVLYKKFIQSNKNIVVMSLILSLYCYVVGYIHVNIEIDFIIKNIHLFQLIVTTLFVSLAVKFIFDFWTFIKVFYLLIKKD